MKVYVVMSGHLDADDVINRRMEAVFSEEKKAKAFAVTFDDEHCINREELYMVPEDIYEEYLSIRDEYPELKIESYKGYAPEAFAAQARRCELYDENWIPTIVDEWEVL